MHGYLSRKESFYYQIERLSQNYRVLAPDMLGFGASSPLTEPFSVGDYADWLYGFLKAENATRVCILAHSFGARVAFKLISSHPGVCKKLIVTGGAGIVKPKSRKYKFKVRAYRLARRVFPRFAEKHFGSAEYRTLSPVMRESYKKIVNEDLSACAAAVVCPTYLIYGADDRVTPPSEEGRAFLGLIPNSKLDIIGGGHFCFSEQPRLFNDKIMNFLTED